MAEIACPDCHALALEPAGYDSEEIDGGFAMFCRGCGFEIAGRDEGMIRSAVLVLVRWNREEGGPPRYPQQTEKRRRGKR